MSSDLTIIMIFDLIFSLQLLRVAHLGTGRRILYKYRRQVNTFTFNLQLMRLLLKNQKMGRRIYFGYSFG